MCDNNVGVVKRLDLEKISREIADLVKELDEEVKVPVKDIKKITKQLEEIIEKKPYS